MRQRGTALCLAMLAGMGAEAASAESFIPRPVAKPEIIPLGQLSDSELSRVNGNVQTIPLSDSEQDVAGIATAHLVAREPLMEKPMDMCELGAQCETEAQKTGWLGALLQIPALVLKDGEQSVHIVNSSE